MSGAAAAPTQRRSAPRELDLRTVARATKRLLAAPLRYLPGSSLDFGPPRGIEASTDGWLRAHGAGSLTVLSGARSTARAGPLHADPPIARRFDAMSTGWIKERAVAEIRGARFWGTAYGCVITPDDRILHDLSPTFSDFESPALAGHDGLFHFKLPPLERVAGTLVAVNTYGHANFHHWLLDTVPAFGLLRDAGVDLERVDALLLQASTLPFHRETLARLGIALGKIRIAGHRDHLLPDQLIVPTFSEPGPRPDRFDYTPEGLRFLRRLFLDGKTPSPVDADKIVVSREKATTRRLLDGDRIHERLRRAGYAKVYLEDFTVAQQAALFHRARVIIMPTGGGLANVAFCEPGARLVELFSPAYLPTFCLPLTQALGVDYVAVVGEDSGGAVTHSYTGNRADIRIAEDRLLELATRS